MIIGVTADRPSLDALCEEHFGRAPYFIITHTDSGEWRAVENPSPGPCGGKVPGAIRILLDHGIEVLITGRIGGSGQEVLEAAGIRIFTVPGDLTVREALARFREGSLDPIG